MPDDMISDPSKETTDVRIRLGKAAIDVMEMGDPNLKGSARLDAAILQLQAQADAAKELVPLQSNPSIEATLQSSLTTAFAEQTAAILDVTKSLSTHHEAVLKTLHDATAKEMHKLHIAINILRDMFAVLATEDTPENITDYVRQMNAEVDALIAPLKAQTYDAEKERNARRNRLSEQLTLFAQRSQEGGQGIEQDAPDNAKEELERER